MSIHQVWAEWSAWGWPLAANHLWQATLFSLLALAAVALLRRAPARARYAVWLLACMKFALPSVLLLFLAARAGVEMPSLLAYAGEPDQQAILISQIAAPALELSAAGDSLPQASMAHHPAASHSELYCAMTLLWLAGFVALLSLWWKRKLRFALAMRAGRLTTCGREANALHRVQSWLGIKREVRLVISPAMIEPGVWGTFRPTIIMPESIAAHLSDAELEAVIMHELVHVMRWDNLASNVQMFLCCAFWFHPLIWLIDRKLLDERERACDERVVELTNSSAAYASSLLKVLRFCLDWKTAGVSSAAGSNLRRRIEQIMADNTDRKLLAAHRIAVAAVAAAVVIFSIAAGLLSRDSVIAQSDHSASNHRVSGGVKGGVPGGVAGGVPGGVQGDVQGGVEGGVGSGVIADGHLIFSWMENSPVWYIKQPQSQELLRKIQQSPATVIQFTTASDSPLIITSAQVRAVKLDEQMLGPNSGRFRDDFHFIAPEISVINNTDRVINRFALRFTNQETKIKAYVISAGMQVPPNGAFTLNALAQNQLLQLIMTGDPADLSVEVTGVHFDDGETWGVMPPLPPPPPLPERAPLPPAPRRAPPAPPAPPAPAPDAQPPAQMTDSDSEIARKPGGALEAAAITRVNPVYPDMARVAKVSGSVVVEVIINEEGEVESAEAVTGHPLLRDAAVAAAREWKFKPITHNGAPVKVAGAITFGFTLEPGKKP